MDKLLKKLWSVIEVMIVLLIWPTIVCLSIGVAVIFNIPIEVAVKCVLGIALILVGTYGICKIRSFLKESKVPKILVVLLGWLGPLSLIWIGVSIMVN